MWRQVLSIILIIVLILIWIVPFGKLDFTLIRRGVGLENPYDESPTTGLIVSMPIDDYLLTATYYDGNGYASCDSCPNKYVCPSCPNFQISKANQHEPMQQCRRCKLIVRKGSNESQNIDGMDNPVFKTLYEGALGMDLSYPPSEEGEQYIDPNITASDIN